MFSKLLKFGLAAVFLLNLGCGLKLGEKNKTENIAEIKGASCLTDSLDGFKLFFAGDATDEQVSSSLLCLQNVIVTFKENIRGQDPDSYTPEEVSNFLSKQFLKDGTSFRAELMSEIIKLKVVLLGGDTKVITKTEIDGLASLVARLKPELVKLNPHMKIIVSKWTPDSDALIKENKFIDAKAAFETFLNRIALMLASTKRSYEINDLVNLVIEAAKYAKTADDKIEKIETAKLLIGKFKEKLIGGNTALVGNEWVPFTRTLGEAFFQLLRYKYFFESLKENQIAEKWKVHKQVAKDVVDLLRDLLEFKETHFFSTADLTTLVLTAQELKYLNSKPEQKKFSKIALDALFEALWKNILNKPEERLSKKVLPGFNTSALETLATELNYWVDNQIIIGELYADKNEYSKADLLSELSTKRKSPGSDELVKVISARGFMNFDEKGYLEIITELNDKYHVKDLQNTNLTRTLARVIIRSYANEIDRINKLAGITLEEAEFAFAQLKELIYNLELVDPANTTFISSRFRESNLFLSVSNGDSLASFEEINHLVLHILSGINRADSLKVISMEKCLKVKNENIAKSEFNQNCLLDMYYNEVNSFGSLPGFAKLKTDKNDKGELKFSPEQNKAYYLGLLKAAGYVPNDKVEEKDRTVLLEEASLFPHVVQYVEMIYSTHDTNRDGYLQKDEAFRAFPVFEQIMKPVQKQFGLEDKDLVGLFVWLLKKGTVFPINNMKKFVKDHECNLHNDSKTCAQDWTINSTRIDIGKIFNLIAALTAPPKPTPVADTVTKPEPAPAEPAKP